MNVVFFIFQEKFILEVNFIVIITYLLNQYNIIKKIPIFKIKIYNYFFFFYIFFYKFNIVKIYIYIINRFSLNLSIYFQFNTNKTYLNK